MIHPLKHKSCADVVIRPHMKVPYFSDLAVINKKVHHILYLSDFAVINKGS
jgi:hypothetical protein